MKKIHIFLIAVILLFTFSVITYLIITATEIQKYAMTMKLLDGYKNPDSTYLDTVTKLISSALKLYMK